MSTSRTSLVPGLLMALVLMAGLTGCSDNPPSPAMTQPLSSNEVLQVLHQVNTAEIEQAQMALNRSRRPGVIATAQRLLQDHRTSEQQIQALTNKGTELAPNALSRRLQQRLIDHTRALSQASHTAFNCAFLEQQIRQHQVALKVMDVRLQPEVHQKPTENLLAHAREMLTEHLQLARENSRNILCTNSSEAGDGPGDTGSVDYDTPAQRDSRTDM